MKTIGIGSLPHLSIENAVAYSLKHDIPFLPQMTSLNERMIEQVLSSKVLEKKYQALQTFTEKILEKKIIEFKIQVAGPCTCNTTEILILNEINRLLKFFNHYKLKPIIFIDEPILQNNNIALMNVCLELQKMQITSGLHSCATFKWHQIENFPIEFISFDLGLIVPDQNTSKKIVAGIPPFSKNKFSILGEYISSSCGLAAYSEEACEAILVDLKARK